MNNIPIFDSLTHPTLNGDWILPRYPQMSKIDDLLYEMDLNNICCAFAVGMESIGGYDETHYSEFILSKTDKLLPIAFFNVNENNNIDLIISKLKYLKTKKYRGIKLHPRIGKFNLLNPLLPEIIKAANDENLIVLFCTYFYEPNENVIYNNVENLLNLLIKIPNEKIILLHSGSVRLLEMMEIARAFNNVLLDLSFTINKYAGSSLDNDIQFLFQNFDKRICIGTDYPEFTFNHLRNQFDFFAKTLSIEKQEKIAYKNLKDYIA